MVGRGDKGLFDDGKLYKGRSERQYGMALPQLI